MKGLIRSMDVSQTRARKEPQPFVCKRCGNCCLGDGYVNVSEEECREIAKWLDLSFESFLDIYTVRAAGFERWLINGGGGDKPCIFLIREEGKPAACRIEKAKPQQCRDFPKKWHREDARHWCVGLVGEKARNVRPR